MSTQIDALSLFFFYSGRVAGATVERGIIDRAKALFDTRSISQREFADALGVSPSWVSAFFAGKRPANDIHLLMKIARYFGVSVGYLLNESERGRDAGATTLLAAWNAMDDERDRQALLNLALMLKGRGGETNSARLPESPDAPSSGGGTTKGLKKRR